MKLLYNDVDITQHIKIMETVINDNCGGIADSVNLIFSDTEKLWRKWSPQKGDKIELLDNLSTGIMHVDEYSINKGIFSLGALSIPQISKVKHTKSWGNIRFKKLAKDLIEPLGFSLETFGVNDWSYESLDQVNQTNLEFLNFICILEGYNLKIYNNKAIIYNEFEIEKSSSPIDIYEEDFIGDYEFFTSNMDIYSSCEISYFNKELLKYEYKLKNITQGPVLKINDIKVNNFSEAERFSRGLLKNANKKEFVGSFVMRTNENIAAASIININNLGVFSGKYFIESINRNVTSNKSRLNIRKVLEWF